MKKLLDIYNKYKLIMIVLLLVIIIAVFILFNHQKEEVAVTSSVVEEVSIVSTETVTKEDIQNIKVDIKGAINNPGVYEISNNARVIDLINISGGLTKNADTSIINLSKKLEDGKVVVIYTKEEVKKIKEGNIVIEYIENECNCEKIENSSCIDPDTLLNNDSNNNSKININSADIKQLQTITGIGESKANDIIDYRNTNGLFKKIDDIKNVKGIGESLFEKIKDNITV